MPPKWAFKGKFGKGTSGKGKGKGGKGKRKKKIPEKLAGNPVFDDFRRYSQPLHQLDLAVVAAIVNSSAELQEFTCTIPKFANKSLLEMFGDFRSAIDTAIFFELQEKANSDQQALAQASLQVLNAAHAPVPEAEPFADKTRLLYIVMQEDPTCAWFKLGTFKLDFQRGRRDVKDRYLRRPLPPGGVDQLGINWETFLGAMVVKKVVPVVGDNPEADFLARDLLRAAADKYKLPKPRHRWCEFHHIGMLSFAMDLLDKEVADQSASTSTPSAPASPGPTTSTASVQTDAMIATRVRKVGKKVKKFIGSILQYAKSK